MANIVYGSELSKDLKAQLKEKIEGLKEEGKRVPALAVILVGDNPASVSYVRGKEKACQEVGIRSVMHHIPAETTQEELETLIGSLAKDDEIDGILVQLPLPKGLDEERAIACIGADKDVDGLHPENIGRFYLDKPCFVPCTPLGIMELLKRMGCNPDRKRAVVVGRSKLVGTPVARLLQNAGATVTVCHSHTENMKEITRQADILVAAIGKAKFLDESYISEGTYVIDVGVNRLEDGHLVGDCDFESMKEKAAAITPVPKGVGPMTITMLLWNTYESFMRKVNHE